MTVQHNGKTLEFCNNVLGRKNKIKCCLVKGHDGPHALFWGFDN